MATVRHLIRRQKGRVANNAAFIFIWRFHMAYKSGMLRCKMGSSAKARPAPITVQAMGLSAT
jgi:hypothetical protein